MPGAETLVFGSLASLAAKLSAGETSAREVVAAFTDRAVRLNRRSKAIIEIADAGVREEVERCDREMAAGRSRGPLHGVPYAVRDLIGVAGVRITAGSGVPADNFAEADAHVAGRLRASGAI